MADVSYNIPDLRPGEVFRCRTDDKAQPLYRFCRTHSRVSKKQKLSSNKLKPNLKMPGTIAGLIVPEPPDLPIVSGASDDGEPHGTAGRPMLTAVTHSGIGEVTVVVTRYFGGILLGTGGLVKAYQSSVKMALEGVPTRVRTKTKRIKFSVEHRFVNQVLRKIEAVNGRILEKNFDMGADFDVEIPEDLAETFAKELEELTRGALLIEFVEE